MVHMCCANSLHWEHLTTYQPCLFENIKRLKKQPHRGSTHLQSTDARLVFFPTRSVLALNKNKSKHKQQLSTTVDLGFSTD